MQHEILEDKRRLTVAITRAKHKLIIIGDVATVSQYSTFKKLIPYLNNNTIRLKNCQDFSWDFIENVIWFIFYNYLNKFFFKQIAFRYRKSTLWSFSLYMLTFHTAWHISDHSGFRNKIELCSVTSFDFVYGTTIDEEETWWKVRNSILPRTW